MRILQINTTYKNGGSTGRIAYDLKNTIENNGMEAYVAFGFEYVKTNDDNTFKLECIPELKWNILKTRIFARHGFYNINSTKRLLNYIDRIKPDIIHLHNIHNHYVNVEMLFDYIKKHNIPVVWTLHDCWSFTGWCAYFDYANCDRWKTLCHDCPCNHDYPFTWFFDRSSENYEKKKTVFNGVKNLTIVTPSEWLSNLVKQSYLKNYPVKVINNGVDISVFKPLESKIKEELNISGKKMILAMGMTLNKRKGIEYLMKLRKELNDDERLVLVGVKASDKSKIETDKCICMERTSNIQRLVELYSAADVFINPTLEDNFPTTNIEALSCGTPVVTFNTGGSVESVDESTGHIVEKGNLKSLLDSIRYVCDKGKIFYSDNCRTKAVKLYNKYTQYGKY
ncbi:MAG: glycosyltransferase, partial [Prevotella sp.]|nr:glycosyltransferase [Prevotella sp.]